MPNETDLIKEIEEAAEEMTAALAGAEVRHSSIANLGLPTTEKIRYTLQRAREALRWIPVEKESPTESRDYEVTVFWLDSHRNSRKAYYVTWSGYDAINKKWGKPNVVAFRRPPAPYTPAKEGERHD